MKTGARGMGTKFNVTSFIIYLLLALVTGRRIDIEQRNVQTDLISDFSQSDKNDQQYWTKGRKVEKKSTLSSQNLMQKYSNEDGKLDSMLLFVMCKFDFINWNCKTLTSPSRNQEKDLPCPADPKTDNIARHPADPETHPDVLQSADPATYHAVPKSADPATYHAVTKSADPATYHAVPKSADPAAYHAVPKAADPATYYAVPKAADPATYHAVPKAADPATYHAIPKAADPATYRVVPNSDDEDDEGGITIQTSDWSLGGITLCQLCSLKETDKSRENCETRYCS